MDFEPSVSNNDLPIFILSFSLRKVNAIPAKIQASIFLQKQDLFQLPPPMIKGIDFIQKIFQSIGFYPTLSLHLKHIRKFPLGNELNGKEKNEPKIARKGRSGFSKTFAEIIQFLLQLNILQHV